MEELVYRPLRYRDRWFAYLDLLGFTDFVNTKSIEEVIPIYSDALSRMRSALGQGTKKQGLLHSWFSDTFIIYTGSDSLEDFARLESAARIFFQLLINKHIPVRGCISHGKLYSQSKKNIFIGPALIEAHAYGEALDWIGFCLAPSVEDKLKSVLPLDQRAFYRKVSDRKVLRNAEADCLYAYAFNNGSVNGKNHFRKALVKMRENAPEKVRKKYDHALEFIDKHA
ncbi:hypothetical protein [Chlorobium sp. N1]|uniref:hypothetical protein n=1 Tax=Chlorobium sp. N1 TaxID=2491138 RepID=UPI00103E70A5|nr:hypothetical protein [Chlorobium sp. N1]TCD48396.1 hypothetical protein E0L29_00440 [Chlorobium sp. N1]